MPRRRVFLFGLFFCSGACGLIYQVLWLRELSLVFGVTVYAASTVLAAFMGGLALGSALANRLLIYIRRPLAAFGAAEIGVGISALATPLGLAAADAVYAGIHRALPDAIGLMTLARLACSMLVLLVPTMLMGVTLPLLSSSALVRESHLGSRMSGLYAVNTAGAMGGAIAAGFYLIGALGMRKTFLVAAAVNIVIGIGALRLARGLPEVAPMERAPDVTPVPAGDRRRLVALAMLISGVASLGFEIVWFRVLAQFLEATTYAFTTMLATVLLGIAAGGALASRLLTRERDWLPALACALIATGIAAEVSLIALARSYQPGWSASGAIPACAAAILPAALCMGIGFPMALREGAAAGAAYPLGAADVAVRVGRLYALNLVGAILGVLATGFAILPRLGSRSTIVFLSSLFVAAGLVLLATHPRRLRLAVVGAVGLVLFLAVSRRLPDPLAAAMTRRYPGLQEFFREEGAQTTVNVRGNSFHRLLLLDGIHQADDSYDMVNLHSVIGQLPMVLHPSPVDVLVVGLGGGVTPGAMSRYPGARVQIIELSESVVHGAAFFGHVNHDVLGQPNVRIRLDDGRNFLKFTGESFDVITADLIQPVHAGAGNLYSREYFALVRRALRRRGLALQWIGHGDASHYKAIMRTFLDVFPDATLWYGGTLLVGSLRPLSIDPGRIDDLRRDASVRAALDGIGLSSSGTLRSWFTAGPDEMRRFAGDGPILTDDRPLLEYYRSMEGAETAVDFSRLQGDVESVLRKSR